MRHFFLLALAATVAQSAAHATDCGNPANQMEINYCAGGNYRKVDAELNAVYGQIQHRLKNDQATAKLLVAAQRSWIGFRDSECTFASSPTIGGSLNSLIWGQCAQKLTERRLSDLKFYLHCQEGDPACPVPAE